MEKFLWIPTLILILSLKYVHGNFRLEARLKHNLTLTERLEIEKSTYHWYPYQRIAYHALPDGELQEFCLEDRPSAIEEFPDGIWTREQRLQGLFLIHIFIALYLFIALAFICDKYFLPTVEVICEVLNITQDVAASTFMATATTIPEFFANTISTFIAESDMGLSAIIGSMMFNTLGVAACASLFTKKPIQIDWWPITRDSILFSINIVILVTFAWDGVIMWWESCILVTLYVGYWILMFQNPRIKKFVKHIVEDKLMWCQRIKNYDIANQRPYSLKPFVENGVTRQLSNNSTMSVENGNTENFKPYYNQGFDASSVSINVIEFSFDDRRKSFDINSIDPPIIPRSAAERRKSTDLSIVYAEVEEEEYGLWEIPKGVGYFNIVWFFFTWPIKFLLQYTIPNPITHKKWYIVSFIMCIIWIGGVSYLVFWMVVIIGDTFGIPDAVMGLTFLAFGGCMPEAISAVIVARQGSGQMGVSNALGANNLAILFSLGLPWFIRTMVDGAGFNDAQIRIFSSGIEFTIMTLLIAVAILYISMAAAGYKLRKTVGLFLGIGYVFLATFAILVELNVLFVPEGC